MDRETLNEIARLKFGARSAGGPEIDLVKLAGGATYAVYCAQSSRSMTKRWPYWRCRLRDKFGLLAQKPARQSAADQDKAVENPSKRYLLSTRS